MVNKFNSCGSREENRSVQVKGVCGCDAGSHGNPVRSHCDGSFPLYADEGSATVPRGLMD